MPLRLAGDGLSAWDVTLQSAGIGGTLASFSGLGNRSPQPLFAANLTTSLVPEFAAGSNVPSYSRASAAYVQDHEGVQRQVLANEARFWGARRVRNLFTATTALSTQGVTVGAGRITVSFTGTGSITFTGAFTGSLAGTGATSRVQTTFTTTAGTLTCTVAGSVTFAQCEDVTGQSVETMSEYVSVGVLSSPWQGANVDGVQYFDTVRLHTQNQLTFSEQFDDAAWSKSACSVTANAVANPVDGALTADALIEDGTTGSRNINQFAAWQYSQGQYSVWAKAGTRNYLWAYFSALAAGSVIFDLVGGTIVYNESGISASMVGAGNGWYLCTLRNLGAHNNGGVVLNPNNTTTPANYAGVNGNVALYLYGASQRTYSPSVLSTYVPTTTAAVGPTDTGTTAPIPATTLLGYLPEPTAAPVTQLVATAAATRDMAQASWTLGVTMTRDATPARIGMDGVPNTCTRLTAGAVPGTNTITQTLVGAAVVRTYSCYIRRVTGSGPVRLTQDNFATSTNVSAQLVLGQWVRVRRAFQSILNPVFGIQLDTNLDAIDVDFNQFELDGETSPMGTAGLTRNPDFLSYPLAGNVDLTKGSAYAEESSLVPDGDNNGYGNICDLTNNELLMDLGGQCYIRDGTTTVQSTGGSAIAVGTPKKLASAWGSLTKSATITGGTLGTGACAASLPGSVLRVGTRGAVSASANLRPIRNLRIYSQKLTDAQLTAMVV